MIRRFIVVAITVLFTGLFTSGQQLPLYSQYFMNRFLLNPAIAGSDGYTTVNLTAREQWIGIPSSPKTHALSAQTRLLKRSFISRSTAVRKKIRHASRGGRVGVGGYIFNDQNGLISRNGFQASYAYHIPMRASQLSFGISVNAFQLKVDESEFVTYDPTDPYLNNYDGTLFIPDANFGVYYMTREYYVGFSALQLFRSSIKLGSTGENDYQLYRHFYIMGGYNVDLTGQFMLRPAVLLKSSDDLHSFQVDLNATVYYQDAYWGGISYRTGDAITLLGGVKFQNYYFGYAFDYSLSDIRKVTFGSHELTFVAKFGDNARRYRWINRY
jgi:type IX secretion system PorP/SprF family membrane protein